MQWQQYKRFNNSFALFKLCIKSQFFFIVTIKEIKEARFLHEILDSSKILYFRLLIILQRSATSIKQEHIDKSEQKLNVHLRCFLEAILI